MINNTMDEGSFYQSYGKENDKSIAYPSTTNSENGSDDCGRESLSQSMNQINLKTFRKDSSDFYDYQEEPPAEQNINQDNDCLEVSAANCFNEEIHFLNPEENISKLETHQENKNTLQSKEFSNFQQPQRNELEFNKNENPNEVENQTYIHIENNLMHIEEHSYNLPSPDMIMNSNKVDLNSSNINNEVVEEDGKKNRNDESDLLRQTTVRKIIHLLNDDILQPLIREISEEEIEKDYILELTISNKIISVQEELENFCYKSIYEICLIAKKARDGPEAFEKNKKKINDLLENTKKKDNLYYEIFIILMDLRFIDIIKIYYDKAQINNILKRYSKTNELLELILANFGDFEKDFRNESNEKINNRKKALKNFIDYSEKIRKQKKIRFITS